MQLGPVVRSKHAKKFGFETSFLERLIQTPLYDRNSDMFADHGCYDPLLVSHYILIIDTVRIYVSFTHF